MAEQSKVAYSKTYPFCLLPFIYRTGDWTATPEQLASFDRFAYIGDPVADALVDAIKSEGGSGLRRQFETALTSGIDTVPDAPEVLAEFFRSVEDVPYWVDPAKLKRATEVFPGLGPAVAPMLMVGLSLTYTTVDGNDVLLRAGDTRDKAGKRATETLEWVNLVTQPGGLEPGAPGFQASVRVRLTHAFMRSGFMKRGDWDNPHLAVNQQVFSQVLVAFSTYPTVAAIFAGKWLGRKDREAIYHLWRYVGHIIGIHPELLTTDQADALRLASLFMDEVMQPDDNATMLSRALIDAYPQIYGFTGNTKRDALGRWVVLNSHSALARATLGRALATKLGYPKVDPRAAVLLVGTSLAFAATTVLDVVPALHRARASFWSPILQTTLARMCENTKTDLTATLKHAGGQATRNGRTEQTAQTDRPRPNSRAMSRPRCTRP